MNDPDRFNLKTFGNRLDALEARVAFQDDIIETLNTTVTEQWAKIDALTRQLLALNERLAEAETQLPRTPNERPPHY
jgi:SlyX protein